MIARWVSVNSISVGAASVSGADSAGWNAIQPSPLADRARPRPRHLAGGEQFVEHRRLVVADPLAEHQRLDRRRRDRHARQLIDHRCEAVDAGAFCEPTCCHAGRNRA